ncbi:hypothetical protein FOCC_FOCC007478 [Frankliniella occidentalis]|nr:hypothetical protein FOCC_FOCC007478 [Frankliniella occidentalis]
MISETENESESEDEEVVEDDRRTEDGFVDGCLYLACKNIEDAKADYHSEMNAKVFEKWFEKVLLPALDRLYPGRKCTIVMDNASYHSRLLHDFKIPTTHSTLPQIYNFMDLHGIPRPAPLLRPGKKPKYATRAQLLVTVNAAVKENDLPQTYACDDMAKKKGYNVLRLPAYHCEYNPIEMAWSEVKRLVQKNNRTPTIGKTVVDLIRRVISEIGGAYWRKACRHTIDVENKDRPAPQHPAVVVNLADDSSSDDDTDIGSGSEIESGSKNGSESGGESGRESDPDDPQPLESDDDR